MVLCVLDDIMDVSIIIVNYNTKKILRNCIISIYDQTRDIDFEIIVSDNNSIDGSVEMLKSEFPDVIIINNSANLGFGAANNRGLDIAKGKYIFYLNSDTVLLNNAIKIFFDFWENYPDKDALGAIGANLLDENNIITHSFGKFPITSEMLLTILKRIMVTLLKPHLIKYGFRFNIARKKYVGPVDYITGAALFLKNNENALYDERYFLYFEETDLQYNNLKKRGLIRLIIDGPLIRHYEGKSDRSVESKNYSFKAFSSIHYYSSCMIYFNKNKSNKIGKVLIKFFVIIIWLYPSNLMYTRNYVKRFLCI
jgi:GT2 family glycosyltransferase